MTKIKLYSVDLQSINSSAASLYFSLFLDIEYKKKSEKIFLRDAIQSYTLNWNVIFRTLKGLLYHIVEHKIA